MPYFHHNGADLFYTAEGEGQPILLLHGWCCNGDDFMFQAPLLLEKGYRVITLDQRGHGFSSAPTGDGAYECNVMAQDAAALLRYLSATPCIVMGHSMGAIVASVLSIQDPDVVRALILIDVSYFLPAEPVKTMGEALTAASDPASAAVTALGALYTPDSPAWMLAVHRRRTLGMQNRALLGSFFGHVGEGKPGNQDAAYEYMVKRTKHKLAVYQSEAAATLERKLPLAEGDEVHVIDGSSHWVHEQRPNEFNEIMLAWLEKSEYFTLRN